MLVAVVAAIKADILWPNPESQYNYLNLVDDWD